MRNYMPELDDLAGSVPVVEVLFLCFLWVDFIEPLELVAAEPDVPVLFMASLVVCVCEPALEDGVGDADCEASWAMAAPPKAIQPASMATISFVLRMTKSPGTCGALVELRDARRMSIAYRISGCVDGIDAIAFPLNSVLAKQQISVNRSE
jgi:hypothetical protein